MAPTVIAFDLYGTLLSTESIQKQLAEFYGDEKAKSISIQARRYQLEYTWRLNSMGVYRSFSELTRTSFRHATKEAGVTLSKEQEDKVMDAYNGLDTFPDADTGLDIISNSASLDPWIFSNGTQEMITSSLRTSPSLSRAQNVLPASKVISVDPLQTFKPDRRTYKHFCQTAAKDTAVKKIWLVSSNPFDIAGAAVAGMRTAWVDRGGAGWVDGLGEAIGIQPSVVAKGVDEAVREILKLSGEE